MNDLFDCIVLGGGPAGATVAALVARAGFETLLVERKRCPGGSGGHALLPVNEPTIRRLGLLEKLCYTSAPRPGGLRLLDSAGRLQAAYNFSSAASTHAAVANAARACNVLRSEFDPWVWEAARRAGAHCLRETTALEILFDGDRACGACLQPPDSGPKRVLGRVIVDATGQHSLLARQLALREPLTSRPLAAIWGHYRGAPAGGDTGDATLLLATRDGRARFWYLPLGGRLASVGVVGEAAHLARGRGKPETVFEEELVGCPAVAERLMEAHLEGRLHSRRSLSYAATQAAGHGWLMVGEGLAALDPVLYSGACLSLVSGEMAADAIIAALREECFSPCRLGCWYGRFRRGLNRLQHVLGTLYGPWDEARLANSQLWSRLVSGHVFDRAADRLSDDLWEDSAATGLASGVRLD